MREKDWTDILNVLCITILVDGKVYKEEVDTFLSVSRAMNKKVSDGMMLTDKMLLDWFEVHRAQIVHDLETKARRKYLSEALFKISDPVLTEPLLGCMVAISNSDKKYHQLEESFVSLAEKIWGWKAKDIASIKL